MKLRNTAAILGAMALSLAAIGPAHARQIFIQMSGNAPAGGDPNLITNTGLFTVGLAGNNSSDNFTAQNPLLIIVGTYDSMGTPTISFSGCANKMACPYATVGTYGLTAFTATFTQPTKGNPSAYDMLGLSPEGGGASENWTNWSGADVALGLAPPTSFQLYAFALDTSTFAAGTTITIDESGAAKGSYIIGYGCLNGTGSSTGCDKNGDILDTPFTNAGLISTNGSSVPEPGTFLLFGAGLAALGLALGRRRKSA